MNPIQFKEKSKKAFNDLKNQYPFSFNIKNGKHNGKNGYWFDNGQNAMHRTFFKFN